MLETVENLYRGDIIGVEGRMTYTDKGEFSINSEELEVLSRGVRQIPGGHFGVEDEELRYRDRALHLITDMEAHDTQFRTRSQEYGAELNSGFERGLAIAELFEEIVEPELVQPVHITDHPVETRPLCMQHRSEEGLIERFESFAVGVELSNAYTESGSDKTERTLRGRTEKARRRG